MDIKIIHSTSDVFYDDKNGDLKDRLTALGGREAGICYMSESYFSKAIGNNESAMRRANTILGSGHHSPFDHGSIGLEISGIPKIMAMLLNSIETYTTSEKSARYTFMQPETEVEREVYYKWLDIFKKRIADIAAEKCFDMTKKEIEKLALENARYMISVFTPTSMGYTVSFREVCYICDWLEILIGKLESHSNSFNDRMLPYCKEMLDKLSDICGRVVHDNKGNYFQFMGSQHGYNIPTNTMFGDMYQTTYTGSFAQLAQAQRHRTIHYEMFFSGDEPGEFGCYIPKALNTKELRDEWVRDFDRVKEYFPQCTLVPILECGRAYWFFVKCKERLCGRAQLEIADRTAKTLKHFLEVENSLSDANFELLSKCTPNGKVVPKCCFEGFTCTEKCRWGAKYGIDRVI